MSKRQKVREWLLEQENGITFTIVEAAKKIGVSTKDISNIILTKKLVEVGALTRRNDKVRKCNVYDIFSRNKLRLALRLKAMGRKVQKPSKSPDHIKLIDRGQHPTVKSTPGKVTPIVDRVRKSPRSHLVMAIDREIKELNDKIKQLQTVRKDFI